MHPARHNLLAPAAMITLMVLIALSLAASAQIPEHSPPVYLNSNAASDVGGDFNVDFATDEAGNWVAVWTSNDDLDGSYGWDTDVFVSRSSDNTVTWSEFEYLNTNARPEFGPNDDRDRNPKIATDGHGMWIAVWESKADLNGILGPDYNILYARSTDNGMTWTDPRLLNKNALNESNDDLGPEIATDGQGNWIVVWTLVVPYVPGQNQQEFIAMARSADNGASWTMPALLSPDLEHDNHNGNPTIATDGAGNWITLWDSKDRVKGKEGTDWDIYISRSTDRGITWTNPELMNSFGYRDEADDGAPHIATNGAGTWVAAWASEYNPDSECPECDDTVNYVLVSHSTDAGDSWSPARRLNTSAWTGTADVFTRNRSIHLNGDDTGRWAVAWNVHRSTADDNLFDIAVAHSDNDAFSWSEPVLLIPEDTPDTGHDYDPAVYSDGNGRWICGFSSSKDLAGANQQDSDILLSRWFTVDVTTDSDGDGLSDWDETNIYHTDPLNADTDGDGLTDWDEIIVHGTSPLQADTDGDGIGDHSEINEYGTDPLSADTDGDGLSDQHEIFLSNTDVFNPDTDNDGLFDGDEVLIYETDPFQADTDSDGFTDYDEVHLYLTNPLDQDTDGDGYTDWDEIFIYGTDPRVHEVTGPPPGHYFSPSAPALLNSNGVFDTDQEVDVNARILADGQGTWLAIWLSRNLSINQELGLVLSRSLDNGRTWSEPEPLDPDAYYDDDNDSAARLGTDGQGTWVVAWSRRHGVDYRIATAYSTDNGDTWSEPEIISNDTHNSAPRLATDGESNWVAVWSHNESTGLFGLNKDSRIVVARSSDNGVHWTTPTILVRNSMNAPIYSRPRIVTDEQGNWLMHFRSSESDGTLISRSTDNGATWSHPTLVGATWSDPTPVTSSISFLWDFHVFDKIVTDSKGTWIAIWVSDFYVITDGVYDERFTAILTSRSTDNGSTWTDPVSINADAQPGPSYPMSPDLTTDRQGNWIAAWSSNENVQTYPKGDHEIMTSRSSDGGITWTKSVTLNTDHDSNVGLDLGPAIATDARGHWVSVWNSIDTLRGRIGTDWDILFTRWDQNDIFVDLNAEENGIWTEFSPVNTLEEAMRLANPGATIHVKSGDSQATYKGSNALGADGRATKLQKHGASGAPVRIGVP